MLFKIKITISENLNGDWIQNIEQAIKLIKQCAPGLMFEWQMGNESIHYDGANSIFVTTNIMINYNLEQIVIVIKIERIINIMTIELLLRSIFVA